MRALLAIGALATFISIAAAEAAWAAEVVLANGDRLSGEIVVHGEEIILQHSILGEVRLRKTDLLTVPDAWLRCSARQTPGLVTLTPALCADPCAPPVTDPCDPEPEEDPCCPAFDIGITFGLSDERGNTDKLGLNGDIEATYRWAGANKLYGRARSNYEEAFGQQTEGKFHAYLRYSRKVSRRGSVWAGWINDRDDFADLLLRSGLFAGYSHKFIDRKKTTFTGVAGAGYVLERRVGEPRLETAAFFGALSYEHEFSNGDSFRADFWITPYVEEFDRSPMRLELRYAHPLREHWDVTASFILDYVADPPEADIESYDTKFVVGLRWKP